MWRLAYQVAEHNPLHRFVCLTDAEVPRETHAPGQIIPLKHDWPGWWAKIELFRPDLWADGEQVVYLDLDSDVIGSLLPLRRNRFTMLADFYFPRFLASGVMAWTGRAPESVYEGFNVSQIGRYKGRGRHGDQGYIAEAIGGHDKADRFGDEVCSYKKHKIGDGQKPPDGCAVIAYHGKPKPWDVGV